MTVRMCKASLPKRSITGNEFSWTIGSSVRIRPSSLFTRSYSRVSSTGNPDVRIVEHSPGYGLQGIKKEVPTAVKLQLIQKLAQAGLSDIETTSFSAQELLPQFADGANVMNGMFQFQKQHQMKRLALPVSVAPNLGTLVKAQNAGVKEIMVSASASEEFSRASQNCTVEQALSRVEEVVKQAVGQGLRVRGIVPHIFQDSVSGATAPGAVLDVVRRLLKMGCYEVSLGDTLGVGTPKNTQDLLKVLLEEIPAQQLAGHFHDRYGQGIANLSQAYEMGIRTFDSSVAGLGGSPFTTSITGNVATEDVVYTLERSGISTGIDLDKLVTVGQWISKEVGIPYRSRAGEAVSSRRSSASRPSAVSTEPPRARRTWEMVEDTGEYHVTRSGTAMKITLTRPNNGNALTDSMLLGLTKIYRRLADDASVYHVILASEGKFFCTGMDLSGNTNTTEVSDESSYYAKVFDLYQAIDHVPQTTIALVDGPCYGGGVGLTFVCDVRLVSPRARWTMSEVKIGVSPAIISKYMVREWGASLAREAMMSGREIAPDTLKPVGAIHGISSEAKPLDELLDEYLDQLQKAAPRAASINKELARLAWSDPDGVVQAGAISTTFANMMAPDSEGRHGIKMFQKKVKMFSWEKFWSGRNPYDNLHLGSKERY